MSNIMKNATGFLFVSPFILLLAAVFINTAQPGFPRSIDFNGFKNASTMASASGVTSLGSASKPATVQLGSSTSSKASVSTGSASKPASQTNISTNSGSTAKSVTSVGSTTQPATVQLGSSTQSSNVSVKTSSGTSSTVGVSTTQANTGSGASSQTSNNTSNTTAGTSSSTNLSNSQSSGASAATQSATNTSTAAAAVNTSTDLSNQQVIQVGGSTPGTIILGSDGTPSTVIIGSTSQTAGNTSSSTAGNNTSTNQSNAQGVTVGNTSTPATVQLGSVAQTSSNTSASQAGNNSGTNQSANQNVDVLGETTKPATVQIGSVAQSGSNSSNTTAGNNSDTSQSNSQGVTVGNTTQPATVVIGNTTTPATECVGSVCQSASNSSNSSAGNNSSTGQSNDQNVVVLGETAKPATVQIGNTTQPATVCIGSICQTASNSSNTTAGNNSSTGQSNSQGVTVGNTTQPATECVGSVCQTATNTSNSTAVTVNHTIQTTIQTSNNNNNTQVASSFNTASGSQVVSTQQTTQAVGNSTVGTVTSSTLGSINNSSVYPVDSGAQVMLQKNGTQYSAQLKSDFAKGVEFYAQKSGVSVAFYLGSATLKGLWQYAFDSSAYPNGDYALYAQITEKGGTFLSPTIDFSINNNSPVNTVQSVAITQQIDSAKHQLDSINKQIDQTVTDAAKNITTDTGLDKKAASNVESNISDLVKTIQTIEQLKDLLAQKTSARDAVNDEIAKLQAQLQSLSPDTLETTRNDIIAQIRDAQSQKQNLDAQISIIQEAIDQKQTEKSTTTTSILALTKSLEGTDVNGTLATVESSVTQDQQSALDLTHKLTQDSDGDGLNDYEEIYVYHTDPYNPDTDGDGYLDGDEVAHGYNPLDPNSHPGQSGTITFQDPRTVPPRQTDMFKVESVQSSALASGSMGIKLEGEGLPNSFVTLFIYSQPLVVVVKTDAQGHWEYLLDKSMSDGMHTVYAAETNSLGMVEARSQEFVFLKSGDSVMRTTSGSEASMASTIQQLENDFGFYTVFTIVLAMSIALLIIGFVGRLGAARLGG